MGTDSGFHFSTSSKLLRVNGRVEPMNRCRLHIHYSGRVQGVGFRYRVKTLTTGYEVIGTVRNLADGRVELIVEGMKEELAEF